MTGLTGLESIGMAAILCVTALLIVAGIIWAVLRSDNKIGPLAAAEQEWKIQEARAKAILEGKKAEAQIVNADAQLVEARSKLRQAEIKSTETEILALEVMNKSSENGGVVGYPITR